jgi:hypothetical protein
VRVGVGWVERVEDSMCGWELEGGEVCVDVNGVS